MVPAASLMFVGVGFVAALLLEFFVLQLADRLHLLAPPTDRGFHINPTPTVGGIAFVLPVLGYLGMLWPVDLPEVRALTVGATLLALIGFVDDLKGVRPAIRLICQVTAAALLVWSLDAPWHWMALVVLVVALVWLVNLYNFMDGIDGIAGAQCLFFCVAAQVLAGGIPGWAGELSWLLSGCVVGFLVYNWPKASIFMGDAGSGFLGLVLGALVLDLWLADALPLVASLILLAGFWFDATWTLCVRILTGQAFVQAHRSHLYQKVAERKGQLWTTVAFVLFGFGWLAPLAYLTVRLPAWQAAWLVLAVLPVAFAAWRLGAGLPGPTHDKEFGHF